MFEDSSFTTALSDKSLFKSQVRLKGLVQVDWDVAVGVFQKSLNGTQNLGNHMMQQMYGSFEGFPWISFTKVPFFDLVSYEGPLFFGWFEDFFVPEKKKPRRAARPRFSGLPQRGLATCGSLSASIRAVLPPPNKFPSQ